MTKIRARKITGLLEEWGLFICFLLLHKTGLDMRAEKWEAGEDSQFVFPDQRARGNGVTWSLISYHVHLCSFTLTSLEATWWIQTLFNLSHAMVTSRLWFHSIACLPLGIMTLSSVSFGWLCSHLSISRAFIHFFNKHSILVMHFLSTLFFTIVLTFTLIPFQLHNSKDVCRPH